jgi:hypothetical protein
MIRSGFARVVQFGRAIRNRTHGMRHVGYCKFEFPMWEADCRGEVRPVGEMHLGLKKPFSTG